MPNGSTSKGVGSSEFHSCQPATRSDQQNRRTADWGGKWGDTVKEHASRYVVSPENHGNFEAMMETKDADGKSLADLVRGR